MQIVIQLEGATPDELRRGAAAATALFDGAGVTPRAAAAAHFKMTQPLIDPTSDLVELTDAEATAAGLWEKAVVVATQACCASWPDERKQHAQVDMSLCVLTRPQWIDRFTMHLSALRARAEPQLLAALGAELYEDNSHRDPVDVAQAEFDEWPPHDD